MKNTAYKLTSWDANFFDSAVYKIFSTNGSLHKMRPSCHNEEICQYEISLK